METRARYALIGAVHARGDPRELRLRLLAREQRRLRQRDIYQVRFQGSVSGLLVGSAVLFNGIRVGEVTRLSLSADRPQDVVATIAVDPDTPVRDDTEVTMRLKG